MADSASRSSSPRGRPSIPRPLTPTDDNDDDDDDATSSLPDSPQASPSRQLEAFSRKVTATAGHLIGSSLGDGGVSKHYQNALGELHKELRRPIIQRSVFSFAQTTPRDIVRSNLSVPEIQHRALSYLPDGLLANIPEDKNVFSLFEGFQASMPSDGRGDGKPHGTNLRGQKLLGDIEEEGHNNTSTSLVGFKNEMNRMRHRLEMMSIRKHMCVAEIREIDNKIANLNTMRKIVLDRLANLEGEESDLEHDLLEMENKIEDLEEELEDEAALAQGPGPISNNEDQLQGNDEFMSKSIYEKINSPKTKSRKSMKRTTPAPVQMEEMEPGSKYREIQAHNDLITALDFDAPFGTLVTAAVDDTVRVWDMNAGRCIGLLEGHLTSVRCLQVEGNIVATGAMDASIRLWDLSRADYAPLDHMDADNELEEDDGLTFENPEDAPPPPPPSIMQDCPLFTLEAHMDEITALHFKGDMLVSGSSDKTLRQWDLVKGRCVQTLDVLWAAAQASATINSTSNGPWRQNGRAPDASADFVGALQCFDAALACGTADGMVRLWDLRSGQVHRSLVGHTGPVTALQFDDVHLVTSSMDRSIRIWDLRTGSIYDAYAYDNSVTSMMFDSRRIVSAAGEDVVKVYDKTDGRHWNCGLGVGAEEGDLTNVSTVERVRIKDGYLVEGRRNGFVGIWSC